MAKVTLLEEIHPLHIIREVKKWPVLYAKDNRTERASFYFRSKIWKEVAKALFNDWDSFSDKEKDQKVTDLMKKWRHLCDTFKRELATEKKFREGDKKTKKKTYVYFKHLLFLLPHVNVGSPKETDSTIGPKLDEYFYKQKKKNVKKKKMDQRSQIVQRPRTSPAVEEEDIDEDKHFLLSLVPSFRKMNEDEKLIAKVEIFKIIKAVRQKSIANTIDTLSHDVENVGDIKLELLESENNSNSMDFHFDDSEDTD